MMHCGHFIPHLSTTPYRFLFGKKRHLPFQIEHKAYWALKTCNLKLSELHTNRLMQMNGLEELINESYANSLVYKENKELARCKFEVQ